MGLCCFKATDDEDLIDNSSLEGRSGISNRAPTQSSPTLSSEIRPPLPWTRLNQASTNPKPLIRVNNDTSRIFTIHRDANRSDIADATSSTRLASQSKVISFGDKGFPTNHSSTLTRKSFNGVQNYKNDRDATTSNTVWNWNETNWPTQISNLHRVQDKENHTNRAHQSSESFIRLQNESNLKEKAKQNTQNKITKDENMLVNILQSLQLHHQLYRPPSSAFTLETLDPKSLKFVRSKLFRNAKFNENYKITQTRRVWSPYLMAQYIMTKTKYGDGFKERHLYHGTAHNSLREILTNNFDWRMVKQPWFGKGVYFANNPYYASHYGKKRQCGSEDYLMIVAKVLVEEGAISRGNFTTVIPSALGHTTISSNEQELIKYDDACFYPEFIVYFRPIEN